MLGKAAVSPADRRHVGRRDRGGRARRLLAATVGHERPRHGHVDVAGRRVVDVVQCSAVAQFVVVIFERDVIVAELMMMMRLLLLIFAR